MEGTAFGVPVGTLTTIVGAVVAVALGYFDIKTGMQLGRDADVLLIGAGLGTLLGTNPLLALRVPAVK